MPANYCSVAELETLGVNPEAIEDVDVPRRQAAIGTVSDYMDGFFSGPATLPLASWGQDVRECCAVLACAKLLQTRGTSYDDEDPFWKMVSLKEKWLVNISRRFVTPRWVDSSPGAKSGFLVGAAGRVGAIDRVLVPGADAGAGTLRLRRRRELRDVSGVVSRGSLSLGGLRSRVQAVDGAQFREDLSRVCGEAAAKMVADGFNRSVDPYGDPWEPLRSRDGKPLLKTGRLRASFAVVVTPGGFRLDSTAVYGACRQYGTRPSQRRARFQPVGKKGKFAARRKFEKQKRGSVALRFLPGGVNPGIPARPMVPAPKPGGLPYKWQRKFRQEAAALATRTLLARQGEALAASIGGSA